MKTTIRITQVNKLARYRMPKDVAFARIGVVSFLATKDSGVSVTVKSRKGVVSLFEAFAPRDNRLDWYPMDSLGMALPLIVYPGNEITARFQRRKAGTVQMDIEEKRKA